MCKYTLLLDGGIKIEFDENVKINGMPFKSDINYNFKNFIEQKLLSNNKLISFETNTLKYYLIPSKIICIQYE